MSERVIFRRDKSETDTRELTVYKAGSDHVGGCNNCSMRGPVIVLKFKDMETRLCHTCAYLLKHALIDLNIRKP